MAPGDANLGERLSKKTVNNIFNLKRSLSKLVRTRRSTVLSLPFQQEFPGSSNPQGQEVIFTNCLIYTFLPTYFGGIFKNSI